MVFSTDNLFRQENIINNAPFKTVITVSEHTSLFLETLEYILVEDQLIAEEFKKYDISTYNNKKKLLLNEIDLNINVNGPGSRLLAKAKEIGSGIYNYMKTNFTIEKIVKFIIDAFKSIISRIWREFEALCMSIVSKSSQIKRLEKKIYSIPTTFTYKSPLFTYTHIRDDKSEVELEEQLNSIYDECNLFIQSFSQLKNNSRDIEAAIQTFNKSSSNDEFELDEIRGRLLGVNTPIYKEDFAEYLFRYFRNNTTIAAEKTIMTPEDIRKRLGDWNLMPKVIKVYQKDRDKLERAGNKLVEKLEKNNLDKYLDHIPATTVDLFSNLILRYGSKIKDTCEIFLIYYANRLDAAKEELRTNTKILHEVAKYIVREGL